MDFLDRLRLDVPVVQAGMGGGVAGVDLVGAVAGSGALGTLGLTSPVRIADAACRVREEAPGRSVAVNLLMPFVRRRHVRACLENAVDAVVLFYGGSAGLVRELQDHHVFVMAQVGDVDGAREALAWGVDGLVAQGIEAGGHLLGTLPSLAFLQRVLAVAGSTPVVVAGGVADHADVQAALDAGAVAAAAGTRFLLTHESAAHPSYKARVLAATDTVETTLFGLGWPARHRVVANAATRRWLDPKLQVRPGVARLNRVSAPIGRVITDAMVGLLPRWQRAGLPLLSPAPPLAGVSEEHVDATPLYAGETALRIDGLLGAAEAVDLLAGRPSPAR